MFLYNTFLVYSEKVKISFKKTLVKVQKEKSTLLLNCRFVFLKGKYTGISKTVNSNAVMKILINTRDRMSV